jgi:hypothetical protein
MPVLTNPRYEKMAQELFKGANATDAHERAGFKRNRGNAARINAMECIRRRVLELHSLGAAKLVQEVVVIDKTYVLQQAYRMFEASAAAALGAPGQDGEFDPKAANVASRFLDQLGRHANVRAFVEQHDVSITLSIDAAISRLEEMTALEGEYAVID